MRRAAALVLALLATAACSDDGSPVVEAGEGETTDTALPPDPSSTLLDEGGPQELTLELTGATEVPGPGDADGSATITLTYDGDQVCVSGTPQGIGEVVAGHIHSGAAGAAGPPAIDLALTGGEGQPLDSCVTVGAEGGAVFRDPTNYYVNLHTPEFPDGALRAQLG